MSGDNSTVELGVKAQLDKLISELKKVSDTSAEVLEDLKKQGKGTEKVLSDATKKNEDQVKKSSTVMRKMLDSLKSDFKALIALEKIQAALKLSEQFHGALKETVKLSDTIRRLGATFGIAKSEFSKFQGAMQEGLGEIGLSSESAADALKGLAQTNVRGTGNLVNYAKTSGMLAGVGGEKGKEGDIAKGLAELIQYSGKDENDMKELNKTAEDVRRAVISTGHAPSEIIDGMKEIFSQMPQELRKQFSTGSLAKLAIGAQVAGPGSMQFIKDYLSKSTTQNAFKSATGQQNLFTAGGGFNGKAIEEFYNTAKKLGAGDVRLGLKALGMESDEAADGFVRLAEHIEEVKQRTQAAAEMQGSLRESYEETMSMEDSFKASINRIKGMFSGLLAPLSQGLTDLLQSASHSKAGAGAVVGGGALLAGAMAKQGLEHILGKAGILGAGANKAIAEEEADQKVYVTNAQEIGEAVGGDHGVTGMMGGKGGGLMQKAGMVAAAGAAGYAVGTGINYVQDKYTQGTTQEGFEGNSVERLIFKLDKLFGGESSKKIIDANVKLKIENKTPNLRATPMPSRGGSH